MAEPEWMVALLCSPGGAVHPQISQGHRVCPEGGNGTQMTHEESDLGTAAFLVVRGNRLEGLTPVDGRRYAFRFMDPEGTAPGAALAYLAGESVPAKALIAA